jgi:Holliday junction DNA helicase RuvA
MIASLNGRLDSLGNDWAVIDVNGIGFKVFIPTATFPKLGVVGKEVKLFTHLHLREDEATLYGFTSIDELNLFQTLIGVSGLGPRLALAMLSAKSIEQITMAIASSNTDLLATIPGIGRKMANRLILELKDKVASGWATAPAVHMAEENAELLIALTSLGYSVNEANNAAATLPTSSDLSLEDKVKLSLQYFTRK